MLPESKMSAQFLLVTALVLLITWMLQAAFSKIERRRRSLARSKVDSVPQYEGDLEHTTLAELDRGVFLESTSGRFSNLGNTFRATSKSGVVTVHSIEPENIKCWSSVQADHFSRYELAKEMADAIWGIGILNADGEAWKRSRALIRPTFKKETIAQFAIFKPHVDRLLTRLPTGQKVDMFRYFQDYIFDTGTEFFFGESALCQDPQQSNKDALAFAEAFDDITVAIGRRRHIGMRAVLEHPRWSVNKQVMYDFVDTQIKRAVEHRDKGVEDDRTILLYEMVKESSDPQELRTQTLQVFTPAQYVVFTFLS